MTKSKAYYEAYLVLQCLSETEYRLIPKNLLDEITTKMEKDDSIKVDPNIPLEKQKLSEKTYDILDKVISAIERAYGKDAIDHPENVEIEEKPVQEPKIEVVDLDFENNFNVDKKSSNMSDARLKEENIRLKSIIDSLEQENKKVGQAKELVLDYKALVDNKELEITKLKEQITKLQQDNADLYDQIQKVPRLFRKIFFKDTVKLLK